MHGVICQDDTTADRKRLATDEWREGYRKAGAQDVMAGQNFQLGGSGISYLGCAPRTAQPGA